MGPVTRVGVTVTFLRMEHAPRSPAQGLAPGFQIVRAEAPSVPFYRYLYNTVGADYLWWLRRTTSDEELAALLGDKAVAIYTLYRKGEPGGFFELDARTWPDVNLSYFGLMPNSIGQGIGLPFLRAAVDEVWRRGARGMTVNTCTADHPRHCRTTSVSALTLCAMSGDLGGAEPSEHAHCAPSQDLTETIALYVHWPFCLAKCPYCDFNSHVREHIDQDRFARALRRELGTEAVRLGRRRLTSVFFGGGTPSLMNASTVASLLDDAVRYFDPADDLEVTLEANPTSIEAGRLADYRAAGVNRVSIGIQSLDETALHMLGRRHSAKEATAALALARRLFPRVSFDLIYARPNQNAGSWRTELRQALAIAADHLSLYQLTIEPGTGFELLHRQGKIVLPDEHTAAALYDATEEECQRAGLLGTRFPTMPDPAKRADTIWPTGGIWTTPALAPERTVEPR